VSVTGGEALTETIELIAAPSNLGLRPPPSGHEPGTWRAPAALLGGGLQEKLAARLVELPRPPYGFDVQPGTRIRNGITIREHALSLADVVETSLISGRFPVVLGGDCSLLLGSVLGARRAERCGLVHLDGHADFAHPGNYDVRTVLGAAAGMDLALVTGRGEPLLTDWPDVGKPLVADLDVIQVGDREADTDQLDPAIEQITIHELLRIGTAEASAVALDHFDRRGLDRVWLHVDLDVLDEQVMPAVDSPGSPGLDLDQLADVVTRLTDTGRVIGADLTIYDPDLDPSATYVPDIVQCVTMGLAPLREAATA
jgi:arginase